MADSNSFRFADDPGGIAPRIETFAGGKHQGARIEPVVARSKASYPRRRFGGSSATDHQPQIRGSELSSAHFVLGNVGSHVHPSSEHRTPIEHMASVISHKATAKAIIQRIGHGA